MPIASRWAAMSLAGTLVTGTKPEALRSHVLGDSGGPLCLGLATPGDITGVTLLVGLAAGEGLLAESNEVSKLRTVGLSFSS